MREDISSWFNLDVTSVQRVEMEQKRKKLILYYFLKETDDKGEPLLIRKELNKIPDETRLKLFLQKDLYLSFGDKDFD